MNTDPVDHHDDTATPTKPAAMEHADVTNGEDSGPHDDHRTGEGQARENTEVDPPA